ncbi:unnamed protein product [Rhizoctonia solani]|uniref:Transmembrane protein n=1 Tax=Rhizoctonia solani TaxID=456999 RepID=A0A8H3AQH7_9AGAM|nr:unnamed protein product [Rhizoctonia solani]
MLHANGSLPTKAHRSQMMRMKREVFPRAPQVSVITKTVYASSTAIPSNSPQVENAPIPLGPIVGGILGGMLIVLVAVGGWWWWGSRLRASKAKGAKARRAQHLTAARTRHSRTDSTENLKTSGSHSKSQASLSEKTREEQPAKTSVAHESIQKPSAILAQEKNTRPPFMHQTNSSASLASSRYAPSRPSPLALNVVTRAPSALSENPPTVLVTSPTQSSGQPLLSPQSAALRSLSPLPPKVHVLPPSPPPPVHTLPAPALNKHQRQSVQSVQSVASDYSLDSPVGVAYGGDELEREPYTNPRDEWRSSQDDIMSRMRMAAQARGPFGNA